MRSLACTGLLLLAFHAEAKPSSEPGFLRRGEFEVPEASQGVGVDSKHFYAVDDRAIAKYTKSGELVARWEGPVDGPIVHLDSAVVLDGRIYCAHSNYPRFPMTSSIEIWDADTLEHVGSHSLGVRLGSLTWIDRHAGHFWGVFAGYDRIGYNPDGSDAGRVYGGTLNTTLARFDADWQVLESWVFPPELLERFSPMSNSGGSWGPDGHLYLTGHDRPELYRVRLPRAGSLLQLDAVFPLEIRGQGIAWDRSEPGTLFGVVRAARSELARDARKNRVVVFARVPAVDDPETPTPSSLPRAHR
jgi:hypothetical protein